MKSYLFTGLRIFILHFTIFFSVAAQNLVTCYDSLCHYSMVTDTLFNSPQNINILQLSLESLSFYELDFAYQGAELITTSRLAESQGAVAAINGSFFDMDLGGSVGYFEKDDSVISRTRPPGKKWAVADSILNAALVMYRDSSLLIEAARNEMVYKESKQESFVMVSGPLLIKNSIPQNLPDMSFTHKRHPRTCVAITGESLMLICIDGRSEQAAGMTLVELQRLLVDLGCVDAINLDGGGSTSMWIRAQGIINKPSDKTGERPVANALLIMKK